MLGCYFTAELLIQQSYRTSGGREKAQSLNRKPITARGGATPSFLFGYFTEGNRRGF